jgi:hypothetical protein
MADCCIAYLTPPIISSLSCHHRRLVVVVVFVIIVSTSSSCCRLVVGCLFVNRHLVVDCRFYVHHCLAGASASQLSFLHSLLSCRRLCLSFFSTSCPPVPLTIVTAGLPVICCQCIRPHCHRNQLLGATTPLLPSLFAFICFVWLIVMYIFWLPSSSFPICGCIVEARHWDRCRQGASSSGVGLVIKARCQGAVM